MFCATSARSGHRAETIGAGRLCELRLASGERLVHLVGINETERDEHLPKREAGVSIAAR